MKLLIEESVLRQALAELERVSNTWCTSSENEITALRTALDAAEKVEPVATDTDTWRQKAIELGLELSERERERDEWKTGAIKRDNARHDAIEQLAACKKERDVLSGGYDEVRDELAEAERIMVDMRKRLAAVTKERDELVVALTECRSSVKFDLNKYERMALDYSRLGPEGEDKCAIAEGEATRLHKLIDTIDALAKVGADNGEKL